MGVRRAKCPACRPPPKIATPLERRPGRVQSSCDYEDSIGYILVLTKLKWLFALRDERVAKDNRSPVGSHGR